MSAPVYSDMKMPVAVPGRPAYIPEWSPDFTHEDLNREVKFEGRPLGFTVENVMPERRWAIVPATGELVDVQRFSELYQRWKSRVLKAGEMHAIGEYTGYFDTTAIAVPNIVEFVNAKLDVFGKEVPIHFDSEAPPPKLDKPTLYTHDGEVARAVKVSMAPSMVQAKLELLTEQFRSGKWTAAEYAAEVSALTAAPAPAGEDAPAEIPEGFDSVRVTEAEDAAPKKEHWKTREKREREQRAREEAVA